MEPTKRSAIALAARPHCVLMMRTLAGVNTAANEAVSWRRDRG